MSRELLLANHRFPGEYIYKVFGPGTDAFRSHVHAAAAAAVGAEHVRSTERATRSASRICITLAIDVQTVDDVLGLYRTLAEVDGVLMLL